MKKDLSRYENLTRNELECAIDQRIICHKNAERNRAILKKVLIDGASYERIAEEFGLTSRQISNIVYKTEEMLFKHL